MLFNLFPTKIAKRFIGVKPTKVAIINLLGEIFNKDNIKFCIIKGVVGSNLKIIKYSSVEVLIYLLILLL